MLGGKILQRLHENINEHKEDLWDRDDSREIAQIILLYGMEDDIFYLI